MELSSIFPNTHTQKKNPFWNIRIHQYSWTLHLKKCCQRVRHRPMLQTALATDFYLFVIFLPPCYYFYSLHLVRFFLHVCLDQTKCHQRFEFSSHIAHMTQPIKYYSGKNWFAFLLLLKVETDNISPREYCWLSIFRSVTTTNNKGQTVVFIYLVCNGDVKADR